ncbi:MAG: hypothetical protein ABI333_12705 [bacterium]
MKRIRPNGIALLTLLAALLAPGLARAADVNEVATGFTKNNPYDVRFKFSYEAIIKKTSLNREYMGNAAGIDVVKDLVYQQVTHVLHMSLELAVYKDFALYVGLPVILGQKAKYGFASGDRYHGYNTEQQCRDAHAGEEWVCNPDGVNGNNSRFVQDGLAAGLTGFGYSSGGWDGPLISDDPATEPDPSNVNAVYFPSEYRVGAGVAGPRSLWEGRSRSGIDQLHIGLHGLIFSQKRHPAYPDWRFGVEFRLAVGKVMDFERDHAGDTTCGAASLNRWNCRPELNKAVGRGVHEIRFFTTASKLAKLWKNGGIDSFIHIFFQMPIAYKSDSFYSNKYDFSADFGEESKSPLMKAPMKAGIHFGGEFVMFQDKVKGHKITFELTGMLEGHFEGRDYSEAYELLAGSPALNLYCDQPGGTGSTNASFDQFCGNQKTRNGLFYYPGITTVENFVRFGVRLGLHAQITKYAKLSILYAFVHEQEHFLTTDDAGEDYNGSGVIDINTSELNPWHRPVIHQAGHRIRAQETLIHYISVGLKLMF